MDASRKDTELHLCCRQNGFWDIQLALLEMHQTLKAVMSPSRYESQMRLPSQDHPQPQTTSETIPVLQAPTGGVQPHSEAEASPRIMQIRFMVLRPSAGRAGHVSRRSDHQPTSSSTVNHRSTTLQGHKRCLRFIGRVCIPSALFSHFSAVSATQSLA